MSSDSEDQPEIVADFQADLLEIIRKHLRDLGVDLVQPPTDEELAMRYFELAHRWIEPRRRKLIAAPELLLPSDLAGPMEKFRWAVERGYNLLPWLSRAAQTGVPDALLNDWDIHHFHLALVTEPSGQTKRGDDLLFAMVTRDALYALALGQHGQWAEQDMIERVHTHWPKLIAQWRAVGASSATPISEKERLTLRSQFILLTEMKDGTIYCPPGGGSTTARIGSFVVRSHDQFFSEADAFEHHMRKTSRHRLNTIGRSRRRHGEPPIFRLQVNTEGDALALEQASNVAFKLRERWWRWLTRR